jgi:hypothetical protein
MIVKLSAKFANRNKIDQEQCQEDLLKIIGVYVNVIKTSYDNRTFTIFFLLPQRKPTYHISILFDGSAAIPGILSVQLIGMVSVSWIRELMTLLPLWIATAVNDINHRTPYRLRLRFHKLFVGHNFILPDR